MTEGVQLSIVVPCYNEEAVLEESARRLRACIGTMILTRKVSKDSHILFVNDGSSDATWDLIQSLCASDPLFCGLSLSRNFGHQAALLAGLHIAPGDAVISIDADLQDDVEAMEQMMDRFLEGYEVVYGVRRARKADSRFKRLTALGFYRLMGLLGTRTVRNHADYRLMSRRAIEALRGYHEANLFLRGIVTLVGFRSTTVMYDRSKRLAGETKYPLRKMLALTLSAITSFSSVPLRLISLTALFGIMVLTGVALWVLWARIFTNLGVPGWASVLLPVLFIGFLNLLAIGVVGEYMAHIFDEVKARPRYIIADMKNLWISKKGEPWTRASTEDLGGREARAYETRV
jgi:polyisoprenyl-phosphate glycosyltransferase